MGFKFPLATVLRAREIVEQREERLLGQIHSQIVQSRQTLTDLEVRRQELRLRLASALAESASATTVRGFYDQMRQVDSLELAGKEHLARLLALRQQQIMIYESAYRNREVLSSMRHDRLENFQQEQAKRERSAMDDNFSSRRKR